MTSSVTVGSFEPVHFAEFGYDAIAKIDTGAFSGAIHCGDIRLLRRGQEKVLRFTPFGDIAHETTHFVGTYVRSATGHRVRRYIIETMVQIQGTEYPIHIGLSDRSDMKRPVLIGRRFLREQAMIVDVRINQEYDDEGSKKR